MKKINLKLFTFNEHFKDYGVSYEGSFFSISFTCFFVDDFIVMSPFVFFRDYPPCREVLLKVEKYEKNKINAN